MKPAPFRYVAAGNAEEALALLGQYGWEAKLLAGGQSLVPLLNFRLARPAVLVDISRLRDHRGIRMEGDKLVLGGITRQRQLELSSIVGEHCPLLHEAIPHIGHVAVRNRGTIGGSLAHADPAAELPAVALALDAELVLQKQAGERVVAAEAFFVGVLTTALEADEMLVEVRIPVPSPRAGYAFLEVARRHGDFALVGVACLLTPAENGSGEISEARLVLLGVGDRPLRIRPAESILRQGPAGPETFRAAAAAVLKEIQPDSDLQATATYRRHAAGVLTFQALERAWARVEGV